MYMLLKVCDHLTSDTVMQQKSVCHLRLPVHAHVDTCMYMCVYSVLVCTLCVIVVLFSF